MNYLLIGQPNVGKSSIFNILTNQYNNIVHKDAGATRDWHRGKINLLNNCFIYDTPGTFLLSPKKEDKQSRKIIELLIKKIDIFLFVVDIQSVINTQDQVLLNWLRSYNKEIVLIINKYDQNIKKQNYEYYNYGIDKIFFLSCSNKIGFNKLKSYLKKNIDKKNKTIAKNNEFKYDHSIAIFGKPNVGKSTFLNKLLGYQRSLTSSNAGTTSDCVFENLKYKSKNIRIIDTAGISRKSKINFRSINYQAIKNSITKIKEVQSTILLIDSFVYLNRQDKRIIKLLAQDSKNFILVFNKFDLIDNKLEFKKDIVKNLENTIYQLKNIKFFFISSFSKYQVYKVFDYIFMNNLNLKYKFSTSSLNKWLTTSTKKYLHPRVDKRKVNFKYAVKVKDNPITIKIFCNQSKKIKNNYIRYLVNDFNRYFKILNQNTRIIFSTSINIFIKK